MEAQWLPNPECVPEVVLWESVVRSHLSEALHALERGLANEKELRLIRWARKAEWPVLVPRKPKYETNLIDFSVEFDG